MNLKSYGFLNYEPRHPSTRFEKWWAILSVPGDITRYYRSVIENNVFVDFSSKNWLEDTDLECRPKELWTIRSKPKINGSAWGSHVSVIKNEIPKNMKMWKYYQDKKIYFEYNPEYLNTNGKHWWIKVFSTELEDIREELGLSRIPNAPLHLTIGFQNAK